MSLLASACGSSRGDKATPVPLTPTDAAAIRSVNFAADPAMQTALRQLGSGEVDTRGIVYTDLTGDGREDAVVPVTSGGTAGNIAYLVYTLKNGAPQVILTRRLEKGSAGGLKMSIADGKLLETAAEYGAEDPLCCPSVFKRTTFRWDGNQLQVEREDHQKATPGPKQLN
jgi:hypothetical protein